MMKCRLFSFAILVLTMLCISCDSNVDTSEFLDDSLEATIQPQSEVLSTNIVDKQTELYKEILHTAMQEQLRDSINGVQDVIDSIMINSSPENLSIMMQEWRLNKVQFGIAKKVSTLDVMPDSLKLELGNVILDSEFSPIEFLETTIAPSEWYQNLDPLMKHEVYTDLCLVNGVWENILSEVLGVPITMSPGDRMIWRDAVGRMTPEQRKRIIKAVLCGVGLFTHPWLGLTINVINECF